MIEKKEMKEISSSTKKKSFIIISISYILVFYYLNVKNSLIPQCDEPYHLNQTIYYRNNLFLAHTKSLTTFPGTFFLTQIYQRIINRGYINIKDKVLRKKYIDNLNYNEYLIFLFDGRIMAIFFSLLTLFILTYFKIKSIYFIFTIAFLPIRFIYCFLIYTENTSLLFLVIFYFFSNYKKTNQINLFIISSFMILMRQTNIIWINYLPLIEVFQLIYCINFDIKNQINKVLNIIKKFIYVLILDLIMIIFYFLNGKSFVLGSKIHHPLKFHSAQIIHFCFYFIVHFPFFNLKIFEMLTKIKNMKKIIKWIFFSSIIYIIFILSLFNNYKGCDSLRIEKHYNDYYYLIFFCNERNKNILLIYLSIIMGAIISDDFNLFFNSKIFSWFICSCLSSMCEVYVEVRYFLPCYILLMLIINDYNNENKGENFGYYFFNNPINIIFGISLDYILINNMIKSPNYKVY